MPKRVVDLEKCILPQERAQKHAHLLGYNDECTINEGMYKKSAAMR